MSKRGGVVIVQKEQRFDTLKEESRWFLGQKPPPTSRVLEVWEQLPTEFDPDKVRKGKHLASNPFFNFGIVMMIFVNTVMVGVEVDFSRGTSLEDKFQFFVIELVFGFAFSFETAARVHRDGWDYFEDAWNLFDYMLVVLSISDIAIALTETPSTVGASSLRVLRFMRVVRSIKGLKAVSGLWLIVQGLLDSVRTIFWVCCACILLIYCFAVALTTIVGQDASTSARWPQFDVYIGSVSKSMITVLQVITLDSWTSDIARPLMDANPVTFLILCMAIVVLSFGTLNILVAVMVERVSVIAQDNKENNQKMLERTENALMAAILDEFYLADKDKSGTLELKEFRKLIRTPTLMQKLSLMGIACDEAEGLFEIMDVDGSGTVTPKEFLLGLLKVKGIAKGQDVVHLICFAQKQCMRATRFVELVRNLSNKVDEMQVRMDTAGVSMAQELMRRSDAEDREIKVWEQASDIRNVVSRLDFDRATAYPDLHEDGNGDIGFVPASFLN